MQSFTRIPAQNGKHVLKVVTPSGVTAFFASDVSTTALEGLLAKLKKQRKHLANRGNQTRQQLHVSKDRRP